MIKTLWIKAKKASLKIHIECSVKCVCLAAMALSTSTLSAQIPEPIQSPTFSNEVVRVLQEKCQRCHQPGGIGPMPLETYEQARAWAPRIKENVRRRIMPPWHLDPTIGIQEYKNDFSLSDEQIEILVAWVDNGAPEGLSLIHISEPTRRS